MGAEDIAFHFIIAGVLWALCVYFMYGYFEQLDEIKSSIKSLMLSIPASVPNPLVWTRASYCFLGYPLMAFRVFKRFWLCHGFKLVFLAATCIYTWNVWTETLNDDPFTIVGVSPSATNKEINRACRNGSLKLHPDKHPGQEEKIRPLFEKHTRACKLLKDDKARNKYIKYGIFPKKDQKDQDVAESGTPFTAGAILQVGGGSFLLSCAFYFLLFAGVPAIILNHIGDVIYDDETKLENNINECKAISDDMHALCKVRDDYSWSCGRLNSLFIDCAEIFLVTGQAEFMANKARVKSLSTSQSKTLDTLFNSHIQLFYEWKKGSKPTDDAAKRKMDRLNSDIEAKVAAAGRKSGKAA